MVFDNLTHGGVGLLPHFASGKLEFVRGDVMDYALVKRAADSCDAIIHLAAIVGYPACDEDPHLATMTNVDGTRYIASAFGKKLIVLASTNSLYGNAAGEICDENTPIDRYQLSLYGRTKYDAENFVLESNGVALRFPTAFGLSPRMRLDLLVNDFVHQAMTNHNLVIYQPNFMRSFIHVYDMARAFLFTLNHYDEMKGQVYNVGSSASVYSKHDICKMIQEQVDYYLHLAEFDSDVDNRNYVVSFKKITGLGYTISMTVRDGIRELVAGLPALYERGRYRNA